MDKKIFEIEQNHLSDTYSKLLEMKEQLEAQIRELNATAQEEKNDIRDNIRFDTADDEVRMETYGEIETWNRYIDSYNVTSEALHERLRKVNLLLAQAYFASVTLQFDGEEETETYYIGRASISENAIDPLVIDWRSPIAETYYNQENGRTHYTVDGKRIDVDLALRRQYDLERDVLHAFFDTQVAIEDPLLLQSLSRQRSDKMQAITTTIQREQNAVIRHPDAPAILVNGIAGSGKTSVLLQRIAYLFYQQRQTLRPENVYLMTLNPVFRQYIDAVLPDMGERNPVTATWHEFLQSVHCPVQDGGYETPASSLETIDQTLAKLDLTEEDFLPIRQKGRTVLSAAEVAEIVGRYTDRLETGVRLVQVCAEEIADAARATLRRRAIKEAHRHADDLAAGRAGDAVEEALLPGNDENGDASAALANLPEDERADRIVESQYGGAFAQIRDCRWLDLAHIGQRILGKRTLSAVEWFYLRMALTGECDRTTRYVCVDEVQDYTAAQLMVLRRYFVNARFLFLGDEFQAIREGTVSFAQIHELFETTELPLMTSYRSSPEITELFASLLPENRRIEVTSVRRPGVAPVIKDCHDKAAYKEALLAAVQEAAAREGLTAIVCVDKRSYQRVHDTLAAALPVEEMPQTLSSEGALPQAGVVLTELRLAKGLEFDGVILPDAGDVTYRDDTLSRHRLYTAISRATTYLTILVQGEMTRLLRA